MTMKRVPPALLCFVWLVLAIALPALAADDPHDEFKNIDCTECHYCKTPTAEDRCLKACPTMTAREVTSKHSVSEAPDSILLGYIADLYKPVRFDHKAHAGMAEMGLKCATCHHYSPPGHIPPCRECHGGETNPNNLRQPGLKGAYHRHCLSCHREWSHETKCVLCHLPANGSMMSVVPDTTDILGIAHPVIEEPTKRIYHTPYPDGPMVTFYHEEHVQLYGLPCAGCHQDENCSRCHDISRARPNPENVTDLQHMEEVHSVCNGCHGDDKCMKCHDTKEKPPFTHATTGWPLNRFHQKLGCRSCHPTGKPISRLDNRCQTCHGGWNRENFNHVVTGLRLDEIHVEFDCENCHIDRQFDKKPTCIECHEEERDPREFTPGEYVK